MAISKDRNQLKLFMTGPEWQASVTHSTDGPIDSLWAEKEGRARAPLATWDDPDVPASSPNQISGGLYDSMLRGGYRTDTGDDPIAGAPTKPTIIFEDAPNGKSVRSVQSQGHHRVAAAAAVERDTGKPVFIPTNYVDNTSAGRKARKPQS